MGTVQPFRYRGYVYDVETGLYYLRSRYYNPERSRFINADARIKGNLFSYCENRPCIRTDPSGLSSEWWFVITHLREAYEIGLYVEGRRCKNITTTAVRISVNLGLSNSSSMAGEGTQVNAVRHALWTAIIKSKFGTDIAKEAIESHEDYDALRGYKRIKDSSEKQLNRNTFADRLYGDGICDMLNNNIALNMSVDGMSAKEICREVLNTYHTTGLWVLKPNDTKYPYSLCKEILDDDSYNTAIDYLNKMDDYGFFD